MSCRVVLARPESSDGVSPHPPGAGRWVAQDAESGVLGADVLLERWAGRPAEFPVSAAILTVVTMSPEALLFVVSIDEVVVDGAARC